MFGTQVDVFIYKSFLRRRQVMSYIKPITNDDIEFEVALGVLSQAIPTNMLLDIDKQMHVCNEEELYINIDGSVSDNDNPNVTSYASASLIVYRQAVGIEEICKELVYSKGYYIGSSVLLNRSSKQISLEVTGNVAEYIALVKALEFLVNNYFKGHAIIYSDSLLVVEQVNYTSATRSPKLLILRDYARRLLTMLPGVTLVYIPREENTSADTLAKATLIDTEYIKTLD